MEKMERQGPKYHRARAAIKATPNTYATADMAARASLHYWDGRLRRPYILAGATRRGNCCLLFDIAEETFDPIRT